MNGFDDAESMEHIHQVWERDWLAFVVGSRYLLVDGVQMRLAVSLERKKTDVTSRRVKTMSVSDSGLKKDFWVPYEGPIISPVSRPQGEHVFLLHNVATNSDREIALVDSDLEAYSFQSESLSEQETWNQAVGILDGFSDEEYKARCTFHGKIGEFRKEPQMRIEDFKIVRYVS